jgi:hypothetical protein
MKKISFVSAIALAAVSLVGISPAQAAQVDVIAIIDTQFDGANVGSNIIHACALTAPRACDNNSVPKLPTLAPTDRRFPNQQLNYITQLGHYNHGIKMAEIIRKSNPNARLILIRAGSTKVGAVTSQGLLDALRWVDRNTSKLGIDAVSVSLNAGNGNTCKSTGGVKHQDVTATIDSIFSKGTSVLASAGNGSNANVLGYPACIPNVIAVGTDVGINDGANHPGLDFLASANGENFSTSVGLVNWRTSSALTAMAAAAWGTFAHIPNTKQKLRLDVVN